MIHKLARVLMRARLAAGIMAGLTVVGLQPASALAASDPFLQSKMDAIVQADYPGAYVNDTGNTAASGVANVSNGQPANPNQSFRAGSLTKSFVAAVALQLVSEGRLSLNDTVEHWQPGLLPYGDEVTVRMLLNHTSGIPDYLENGQNPQLFQFINDAAFRTRTWTPQEIVALVANQPPSFNPGAQSLYSDTNYIVMGMIIETATGYSIGTEIQNRVIGPLGLTHTVFPTTSMTTLSGPFAHGYTFLVDSHNNPIPGTLTDVTEYNTSLFWATGALISTLGDINTFYHALLGGQLLSADMTAQMKQTVPVHEPDFPPGVGFGLGIWSWAQPCGITIWGHEGEVPGFNTWSFSSEDGSRNVSMEANQLLATDAMFNVEFTSYQSIWCH